MVAGGDAAMRLHRLRAVVLDPLDQRLEALGVRLHVLPIVELLVDDRVQHGVEQRHVGAGLELQNVARDLRQPGVLTARVHHDQLGAARGGVLEIGRGDGMVLRRPRADDDDAVGVLGGRERRRDRARVQAFHQRGDRRGVAQPRAVIDVVGAEARCGSASGTDRLPRSSPWPSRSRRARCRRAAGGSP